MNIFFKYHHWSAMYLISLAALAPLLLTVQSNWYKKFASRKTINFKQSFIYKRLVFAIKAAIVLCVFCFFMTNLNTRHEVLVLSASCARSDTDYDREGKIYVEDVSQKCKGKIPSKCFKEILAASKAADDNDLKVIKMTWPFEVSFKAKDSFTGVEIIDKKDDKAAWPFVVPVVGPKQFINAKTICQKNNLEKFMKRRIVFTKDLFGFITSLEVHEVS